MLASHTHYALPPQVSFIIYAIINRLKNSSLEIIHQIQEIPQIFYFSLGIGIDDTFVMLAAWRRTSIKQSVPERMAITLSEAAVSITITSVTDVISFAIGVFSPFPSVTIFCIYSGKNILYKSMFYNIIQIAKKSFIKKIFICT